MKHVGSNDERRTRWRGWEMGLTKIACGLSAATLLSACARDEPVNGCALAAVNKREVLRAKGYLNPAIPARLIQCRFPNVRIGHIALIYHTDHSWYVYDDDFGSRRLSLPPTNTYPDALVAARAAFPYDPVMSAFWF